MAQRNVLERKQGKLMRQMEIHHSKDSWLSEKGKVRESETEKDRKRDKRGIEIRTEQVVVPS